MFKTILISIFSVFIAVCCSSNTLAVKESTKDCLSLLQIKNEKLSLILDSIINHEMYCDYYHPDLLFAIHAQIIGDSIDLVISSADSRIMRLGNEQGCFEYRGHLFIVYGQYLDNTLFVKTDKMMAVNYYKPKRDTSVKDGDLILDIIEDDSFSIWVYKYICCEFILNQKYTYCN